MLNMLIIVGRYKGLIEEDNQVILKIEIPKNEKNKDGIYEIDKLKFIVSEEKAKLISEHCELGSILGIKGQLSSIDDEMIAFANKITFLSSKEISK